MPGQTDSEFSLEREPTVAERAALAWVVCCERGLDADQERELAEWMLAHARHRELFYEFGGTWALMGRAGGNSAAAADASARFSPFATDADARPMRRTAQNPWLPLAAAAAITLAALGWWVGERAGTTVNTEVGASRQFTLSDGSTVALNTDSAVVTAFAADERRVRLEKGEAFFQVAKDASRPFIVEAAGVGVRAIGTAFNVRVHPASIEVLVTEGKVRVAPAARGPGESVTLADVAAGERVFVPIGSPTASSSPVGAVAVARMPDDEVQRRLAWQDGRLDFSDTSLAEMVAEFNRYNRHKLAVPDPALAAMRFGGSFRPEDREGFVRMLRENFGLLAEEQEQRTVLRAAGR